MVSQKTRDVLWARGAGRCHYCNKNLIGDYISGKEDRQFGFVAHIVADTPGGPRGDEVRSPRLADDVKNLMLMCYEHHKLIDTREEVANFPEQYLLEMKAAHEDRISTVADITADRASYVVRYGAKIGEHTSIVSFDRVRTAMLPRRYPAKNQSIGIAINGSVLTDGDAAFWATEPENLRRQFEKMVAERIAGGEITHMSVFALAPIPLLVQLGHLLGDITPAEVYQLHREPAGWSWAESGPRLVLEMGRPAELRKNIALKVGISATITDDRITSVLGPDTSIWSLTATNPNNDILRYREDLEEFRRTIRLLYDEIKAAHGQDAELHIFPAVPVSVAVEIGRVRMPKADMPLVVYDQPPKLPFTARLIID